ncbi:HEPN domain-containing protein [Methanoculleus chikugoensis]|uniref:HEPN domain-containing protein n=2 Tax=Methanoculleus chikugoensis TaxID=118126 RepID=A0ABM7H767_9EURY|nr:HEPN domain-containing protein [Methanoculleus chikugoensis]BBL68592.1 HEPN domain-containing protein [Methanoculleus chikugoensis]
MTSIEDCFKEKMLRRVAPSVEKANGSLNLAASYLDEAQQVAGLGARRISLTGAYMAWFHAARAVLFRDGIREKSHYCIELYLNHYAQSGDLEEEWVLMFSRMRTQRHESQYSFGPAPTTTEVLAAVEHAGQFIERIRRLLSETSRREWR